MEGQTHREAPTRPRTGGQAWCVPHRKKERNWGKSIYQETRCFRKCCSDTSSALAKINNPHTRAAGHTEFMPGSQKRHQTVRVRQSSWASPPHSDSGPRHLPPVTHGGERMREDTRLLSHLSQRLSHHSGSYFTGQN